ncbi:MAG: response regulator [Rhizobiaceae bacterium]|nr:response regulator [Rhizobiaceae bacterium]
MAQAQVEFAGQQAAGRRVLVAEDSSITQDLLKLVLTQRGHQVDIANDGQEALHALRSSSYDVALLDFHLPKMDGLQVATQFLAGRQGLSRPLFVAITGDVEGLLKHPENCEHFDEVVPKPLNIDVVCGIVENGTETSGTGDAAQPNVVEMVKAAPAEPLPPARTAHAQREIIQRPATKRSAAERPVTQTPDTQTPDTQTPVSPSRETQKTVSPVRSAIEDLGYTFLRWPDDFDPMQQSARSLLATPQPGEADAILLCEAVRMEDLSELLQSHDLHLLPIIDLTGERSAGTDVSGVTLSYGETGKIRDVIEAFHDRRACIHDDLLQSDDFGDKLLGRMFTSGKDLIARYDGADTGFIAFNTIVDAATVGLEATKLTENGLLRPIFFDRLHECGHCGSARLNVREECPECHSANLSEEPYLHHFRCAYQGPESDFRSGDDLICPKCRRELSHFGRDYDKPGIMVSCATCGTSTSEPTVGFVCVDCAARSDGEAVRTRDVFSYALTEKAVGYLEAGEAFLGFTQKSLRFSDLPFDLVVALNEEARRYNQDQTSFALLNIAYENEREIDIEHGPRKFTQARDLFLENLRAALGPHSKVFRGRGYDYALINQSSPDDVRRDMTGILSQANAHIRLDIGASMTVFGPKDFG